jgi:hypothetical protein
MPPVHQYESLINRLNGIYTIPVNDGAGLLNGKDTFTNTYPVPPINREAVLAITELRQTLQHLVNYIDSTGDESFGRSHAFRNAFKLLYGRFPDEVNSSTLYGLPLIAQEN